MAHIDRAKVIEKRLRPSGGWWKNSTKDSVITVATIMLTNGMSEIDIEYIIQTIFNATKEEYGD